MKSLSAIMIRLCLVALIVGSLGACSLDNEQKEVQAAYTVHPDLMKDRDSLLDRLKQIDDYDAVTYTDNQLLEMKNSPESQDYKQVLISYVENELNKQIESYQTIDETSNEKYRALAVVTEDQTVYKILLTKKDEIWIVSSIAQLVWKEYAIG
ncbi:hypothetical protein H8B09_02520 [Paenibacillus sp. PR3]|uniref:DUF4878 domain-containing protein n=1 Tax=Paenibacillus terricola TaxID=2763503 RepID=A0ABR8MNM7_9BACL|nr:hypothetical protein [Paenibacillus terricola]MBD3917612.1 hypothetical protein [Paenibacillus terricola]